MKNETFNGARFLALGKKYFSDNRDWYVKGLIGLFVIILLVYFLVIVNLFNKSGLVGFMTMITIGWLAVSTAKVLRVYLQPKSRIISNLTPASTFEKYLLAWIISLFGSILIVGIFIAIINFAMHYLTDVFITPRMLFNTPMPTSAVIRSILFDMFLVLSTIHSIVLFIVAAASSAQMNFRQKMISVIEIVSIIALLKYLPNWVGLSGSETELPIYMNMLITGQTDGATLKQVISWLQQPLNRILGATILFSLPVVLWITAYYKFKELQLK